MQDLSRNGTFVNGELIGQNNERLLLNDDCISLFCKDYKAFVYKDLSPNDSHGLPVAIKCNYHIGKKLGSGACGVVKMIYDRKTCVPYAMKHVNKMIQSNQTARTGNNEEKVMNEVNIMKSLSHPCVIKMHDIVDDPNSVFMILELMKGGDLLTRIVKNSYLPEQTSKLIFLQICYAVKYLHDNNITHRDLKPDNILLESDDNETLVKVSDFGLSKFVANNTVMKTLCGTPLYVAPEVLLTGGRGAYTKKVDIWSAGVVLYTCLSGSVPFSDEFGTPAVEQIKMGKFSFRGNKWRNVSGFAKALILEMLTFDPSQRPSIDDVLKHKWLKDNEVINRAEQIMGIKLPRTVDFEDQENIDETQPAKRRRMDTR